jgi:t-SNARE complex subunit (syntaxin)
LDQLNLNHSKELLRNMKTAEPSKSDLTRQYVKKHPRATAKEIIAGIKRDSGVEVSPALAAKIRYKQRASETNHSASANGTSKAESIRHVAQGMEKPVRPRDVIAKLVERGILASSAQVSQVLKAMGMKRRKRRGRRAVVNTTVASTLSLESLLAAKKLVNQLGSVEAAKSAVDALAKLS